MSINPSTLVCFVLAGVAFILGNPAFHVYIAAVLVIEGLKGGAA